MKNHLSLAALALLAACGPRIEPVRPIQPNGAVVPSHTDDAIAVARADGDAERARLADERRRNEAAALAACTGQQCDAVVRGELALGMTEAQVLAATRSGAAAWEPRGDGRLTTLAARDEARPPADRVAPVAYVTLENGRVRSWAYQEPEGVRLVSTAQDASPAGRSRARAAALLREGDDFAARGDFRAALDRYDRADVLDPANPEATLRIARALDKQLRPYEATIRYRLFLHQLELERIRAQGEAYAHLYAAAAEARDRIVVLERARR
jgi:tetratricopeptide (TPR) repeat protein